MRVFIAGATGVLGRRLVEQLSRRGHEVIGLVRDLKGEHLVRGLGGTPRYSELFKSSALVHAAEGAEVIIHAATAIPTSARVRRGDWAMNDRIRREGTLALAETAATVGARQLIFQSITWVARPADDGPFNEDSPVNPDAITQSAVDGEQTAQGVAAEHGFAAAILRCGWFYAADSAHTRSFVDGLRARKFPIIGTGNAVWSLLHADDAASAFVIVAESGQGGLWHVVDGEPVTSGQYLTTLAEKLGAPPPRKIPAWLARLFAGRDAVEFLTRSTRTTNERFCRQFNWQPRYSSYREGLEQVLSKLK
jgi:nucleoside-diphosphate-sugar epimerase